MKEERTHILYELVLCHAEGANIKKPIEVFRKANAIEIPDNATNGDVIKAVFPNAEVDADPYSPSVDIRCGGVLIMRVDRNVWNASYKREAE